MSVRHDGMAALRWLLRPKLSTCALVMLYCVVTKMVGIHWHWPDDGVDDCGKTLRRSNGTW